MRHRHFRLAFPALMSLLLCLLGGCKKNSRSSDIKCGDNCFSYQYWDLLPDLPPLDGIRVAIGGDSRNDNSHVMPWAFDQAKKRGAKAFFFLGDLEITSSIDKHSIAEFKYLGDVPFYPAIGNHEVEIFGILRLPKEESQLKVRKFKDEFLSGRGINLASFPDTAVYSVDLEDRIHFIALDNVSRKGEGFGAPQLAWLEQDLKTASDGKKVILVGMHKGLANNPVTSHAMDEDGRQAVNDSEAALALFKNYKVAMVFVSHSHMYAAYPQDKDGLQVRLTGGMGAPLVRGLAEADGAFHHFLLVDVAPGDCKAPVRVQVVKFPCTPPCTPSKSETDETQEID